MPPGVLAIGTTHPLAFTGLLADLAVIRALGARPFAIVAGVSAQSAHAVLLRRSLDPVAIAAQFRALADTPPDAVVVGALLDPLAVRAVGAGLAGMAVPVIVDPVIATSHGQQLADAATVAALLGALIPRATLITPNLDEARLLTGRAPVPDDDDARIAELVAALRTLGPAAVLLTGGHAAGDPVDRLIEADRETRFAAPRIAGGMRGSGSMLAAAIATRLAFGDSLATALGLARAHVRAAIAAAETFAGERVAP